MSDIDQKKSLGAFLKSERERRGLSLDQVSSVTKIGVRILQALEADRYSELPALPFVKGFVKTYCQLLQLDSKQVLSDYDSFLREESKSRPNREGGMSGYAFERPEGEQAKRMLWIVMAAMPVFGTLVVLVFKPSLKHRKQGSVAKLQASPSPGVGSPVPDPSAGVAAIITTPQPSGSPLALIPASPAPVVSPSASPVAVAAENPSPSPSAFVPPATPLVFAPPTPAAPPPAASPAAAPPVPVAAAPSPSPSPVAVAAPSPSPVAAASPTDTTQQDPLQTGVEYAAQDIKHKIVIRALADAWVRYQCDDKKLMRFVLKTGRILVLRGKEVVRLQVSNTASVNLSAGGRNYRPMATSPGIFQYLDTPTLIWPAQARETIAQTFAVRGALPTTPAPLVSDPAAPGETAPGTPAEAAPEAAPATSAPGSEVIPE